MPDRDKVVKGLECRITNEVPCDGCPYNEGENSSCLRNIANDALELLKEQEPVKPVETWNTYLCGNCNHNVYHEEMQGCLVLYEERYTYCPNCGRKVKWDD